MVGRTVLAARLYSRHDTNRLMALESEVHR
jgi:hypothetical protein